MASGTEGHIYWAGNRGRGVRPAGSSLTVPSALSQTYALRPTVLSVCPAVGQSPGAFRLRTQQKSKNIGTSQNLFIFIIRRKKKLSKKKESKSNYAVSENSEPKIIARTKS